jgi:hypothetical protein
VETPRQVEEGIARSAGHCMTAGTASTMTACTGEWLQAVIVCLVQLLGLLMRARVNII